MSDTQPTDYSALDSPDVCMHLFHPRPEWGGSEILPERDLMIPMEDGAAIGASFHMADASAPNILFFHGNGEIVADYHDIVPAYTKMNINFLPVDYRGYGRSTGSPTVTHMMQDCHRIYSFTRNWLKEKNYTGPLVLMGRSLGSASVLELAAAYADEIDGLIIESGFAYAAPLLMLLGIRVADIGFEEKQGFRNIDKIASYSGPTLVIHAEYDNIIPFSDGQALYDASPAKEKTLLEVPGADHNSVMALGYSDYFAAIGKLTAAIS